MQSIKYMHVALAVVANEAQELGQSNNVQSPSKRVDKKGCSKKKLSEDICFGRPENMGGGECWSRTVFSGRPSVGCLVFSLHHVCFVCVNIFERAPRSTALHAHGTNASLDGLCARIRTNTNEAFSCRSCCKSFRVDRARRGNVFLEAWLKGCNFWDFFLQQSLYRVIANLGGGLASIVMLLPVLNCVAYSQFRIC